MPDPIFGESEARNRLPRRLRAHRMSRHQIVLVELSLTVIGTMLVGTLPVSAQTVTNQSEFDTAVQQAITTSQPATINVLAPLPITADTGFVWPGQASPLNINFGLAPSFSVGNGSVGNLTIGAGTNLNFVPTTGIARFMVGFGAGGSGTVAMTGGTITSTEANGNYLVFDLGRNGATGTFNQSGGTVNSANGALQIGVAGGNGTYNLSGNGVLTMAGGAGTVYLGDGVGGVGLLHVSDNASFTATGQMYVGNGGAVGTITQDGANSEVVLNVSNVALFGTNVDFPSPVGTGIYNLIDGRLQIGSNGASFGNLAGGFGYFNQSGGMFTTVGANALIKIGQAGTGEYNLSGGTATLTAGMNIAQFAGSTGTVNQTGGTLTLSGGQIQFGAGTGTYNLNGGTLQLGGTNPITSGAGAYQFNLGGGTIQVLGSNLLSNIRFALVAGTLSAIDTNGLNATLTGVLSGNGGIAKIGAGTLALSGNNTHGGGTFLNAGILQATADNNLGAPTGGLTFNGGALQFLAGFSTSRAISLNAGGGIFDTNGNNATLGGPIGGAGGFTKNGAGILTLTGVSSYAGATTVNAGTLQAGATNVFSPGSRYTIASGGALDLNNFSQTIGSLSGSGGVTLGSATLTGGNDGTSTEFSGVINGTGGLRKVGGGTLGLAGASTYTGPTNIDAGVLNVSGSLASTVFANSGGTLTGNGTIGGLAVASGGTVAPGSSTLNVTGNVGFAPGSVFGVNVNAAGQSGLIAAGGLATLAGGTVQVFGTPTPNLTYTIMTAQQGVSGRFANVVTPNFVFLSPELSYTPTSVLFSLQRTRAFDSTAVTANQANVARALGALPADNPLFQAVLTQTSAAGARQAFDALSGEIHASTRTVMLDDSRFARQAVLGRLRQAPFADATGPMASLGGGGPAVAYAEPALGFADRFAPAESALAYADARRTAFPAKAPPLASREPETAWWTQGVGAWGRINGDQNAAGLSRDLGGFFSGIDTRFGDHWRAGIAGGYTNSNASVGSRASSATIDTPHLAAYAGANYGSWNLRSGATMSWSRIDTSRTILFPGFVDSASTRYDARTAQVFGEVGYGIALGAVAAEPFAGLAWVHLSTDGFNETGGSGSAALAGLHGSDDVGYSTLGARAAGNYLLPNGAVLIPRASVAWQHAFGDVTPSAALAFAGTAAAFTIAGVPLAEDAALVEAGFDLPITPQATVGVSYVGQLAESAQDHSIRGNLLVRF